MNGTSEPHARHDRYLVAALAADDLEPIVRIDAEALVASCHDCAELLGDLRSIAMATAALPLVPRTRDFRIGAADAARLRPWGWRGLLDALGGARATFSRPLATGLTTLGIVGLLVGTIPGALSGISFGSSAALPISGAAAPERGGNAGASPAAAAGGPQDGSDSMTSQPPLVAASAAATAAATTPSQVKVDLPSPAESGRALASAIPVTGGGPAAVPPGGSKGGQHYGVGAESTDGATDQTVRDGMSFQEARVTGPSLLLIGSIVCLATGVGLFLIRWSARRLTLR